jgi:hypothetical protein
VLEIFKGRNNLRCVTVYKILQKFTKLFHLAPFLLLLPCHLLHDCIDDDSERSEIDVWRKDVLPNFLEVMQVVDDLKEEEEDTVISFTSLFRQTLIPLRLTRTTGGQKRKTKLSRNKCISRT